MRKITITVDEGTLERLRAIRVIYGTAYSAVIRVAVLAYYQDKVFPSPAHKK